MKIKNFEMKLYLNAWINNHGFSRYGYEYTLMEAMRCAPGLKDWFHVEEVDYDENFGLEFMRKRYDEK